MKWHEWMIEPLKKYAVFNGRACRSEYWFFTLFMFIVSVCFQIFFEILSPGYFMMDLTEAPIGIGILEIIFNLAVFLPSLGVAIRRLHDTDRSGWWVLIIFIPLIGIIVLIVFFCLKGTDGENRFGPDPLQNDNGLEQLANH